jgi:phage terminase large subunit-like protein
MVDSSRWIKSAADELAVSNGCYFDEAAAVRVVEFFQRFLRHSKGQWGGKPFELLDWQRNDVIYPLFGWRRPDGFRRFRKAYVELPKKNGKSTLAAGIGLYLLVADDEPGAEVYSAATDQKQAGIVHNEAILMVEASAELANHLKVNQSTRTISFGRTKSVYRALSAAARSKEGLNASGIIADELHVWHGRELWDTLKYAFAARQQGLLFAITTAGEDMQGICREQHDYATNVIAGSIPDDRFFGYIRAAGPDDDWTKPETWYKANPSLGITIKLDDFAADAQEAQKTPSAQASFKRYRLNIWGGATNPWLPLDAWSACKANFTPDDMKGRECYGGLDLSTTRDMTAFVLVFPDDDGYRVLPYFWLPEDTIRDPDSPHEFRVWRDQGFLVSTPGNVLDYGFVENHIAELAERFDIRNYGYDPHYATQTAIRLRDEHSLQGYSFAQTVNNFAGPTAEFERLVLGGKLRHNGHPILTAQAGHTCVWSDANSNKRPVKPKKGDRRKIDGIVAGIMALARAIEREQFTSVYESRGVLSF